MESAKQPTTPWDNSDVLLQSYHEDAEDNDDTELLLHDISSNSRDSSIQCLPSKSLMLKWKDDIITCLWALLNISVVVGIVFVNKWTTSHYANSGIVITLVNMWMTCVAMTGAEVVGAFKSKSVPYKQIVVLAVLNSLSVLFGNLSIQYSPVTIYQIFKILVVPMVALMQKILWPSSVMLGSAVSLIFITFGGILSVATTPEKVSFMGLVISFGSTTFSSLFQILTAKKLEELKMSANQLLYLQAPFNCLVLLIIMYFFEGVAFRDLYPITIRNQDYVTIIVAGSLLAPLVNVSMTFVIQRTSALTYSVVSQIKSVLIILGSIIVLHEYPSVQSSIGLVILQIGVIWYIYSKQVKKCPSAASLPCNSSSTADPCSHPPSRLVESWKIIKGFIKKQLSSKIFDKNREIIIVAILLPILVFQNPPPVQSDWQAVPANYTNIPRYVHYVWANANGTTEFPLSTYISVAATYNYVRPDKIYLHHSPNVTFEGYWWDHIKPLVTMNPITVPTDVYGRDVKHIEHISDIIRLQVLNDLGGAYFDTDIIPLRSFDDLFLESKPIVATQETYALGAPDMMICNAFIMGPPSAEYFDLWLKDYKTNFQPNCWDCNSGKSSGRLAFEYPNLVRVLDRRQMFEPGCEGLMGNNSYAEMAPKINQNYGFHLWNSVCNMKVRAANVSVVRAVPYSLFGKIALPFLEDSYLQGLEACSEKNTPCPFLPANETLQFERTTPKW